MKLKFLYLFNFLFIGSVVFCYESFSNLDEITAELDNAKKTANKLNRELLSLHMTCSLKIKNRIIEFVNLDTYEQEKIQNFSNNNSGLLIEVEITKGHIQRWNMITLEYENADNFQLPDFLPNFIPIGLIFDNDLNCKKSYEKIFKFSTRQQDKYELTVICKIEFGDDLELIKKQLANRLNCCYKCIIL